MTEQDIIALEKYKNAPDGSLIFCWGVGFVSNGIRFFQKFENLATLKKLKQKKKLDLDFKMPTHVETKICRTHDVSAEFKGVDRVEFERLLKKDIALVIAEPIIETKEDEEWQLNVIRYQLSLVGKAKYDFAGFASFIFRAVDYFLPLDAWFKYEWKMDKFCSEIAKENFDLPGGKKFVDMIEKPSRVSPEELLYGVNYSEKMKVSVLKDPHNELDFQELEECCGMVIVH